MRRLPVRLRLPRPLRRRTEGERGAGVWSSLLVSGVTAALVAVIVLATAGGPGHTRTVAAVAPTTPGTPVGTTGSATMRAPTVPTSPPTTTAVSPPAPRARARALLLREITAAHRLAARGLPLYCGGRARRMVALTFDGGPGIHTRYAIARLRAAHLHATFFPIGTQLRLRPGLARRERRLGMFGDHAMTRRSLRGLRHGHAFAEIAAARRLLERTVHEPVLLFRPPHGAHTRGIDRYVRRLGMVEVLWDVNSGDRLGGSFRKIERRVITGLRPGSIILMHDNHRPTIRALRAISAALRRRHLRAVTVPQLIAQDPPSLAQQRLRRAGCRVRPRRGNSR